jgi:ABC-type nitrate/sulfonate/bicarbonate transport system ATPase subunit
MSLLIEQVSFAYQDQSILNHLSLSLATGEIGTLIGASGSGKSTLFKLMTGLLSPQSGYLQIQGLPYPKGCQSIAYMMQQDLLLPWRTILSNLLLVSELGPSHFSSPFLKEEAKELLEEMGLKGCDQAYPDELSGGMRQRVSLARAILQRRPVLLLDEPFGALDVGVREQLYRLIRQIQQKQALTILMVTHDFRDALSLSDRIFLLKQGRIQQEWKVTSSQRKDGAQLGLLQQELYACMSAS